MRHISQHRLSGSHVCKISPRSWWSVDTKHVDMTRPPHPRTRTMGVPGTQGHFNLLLQDFRAGRLLDGGRRAVKAGFGARSLLGAGQRRR